MRIVMYVHACVCCMDSNHVVILWPHSRCRHRSSAVPAATASGRGKAATLPAWMTAAAGGGGESSRDRDPRDKDPRDRDPRDPRDRDRDSRDHSRDHREQDYRDEPTTRGAYNRDDLRDDRYSSGSGSGSVRDSDRGRGDRRW